MAPVIPFVTEKIYTNLTKGGNNKESIHLSSFPIYKKDYEIHLEETEEYFARIKNFFSIGNALDNVLSVT